MSPEYAVTRFDFCGKKEGHLTIYENDIVRVLQKDPSGWWLGVNCQNGEKGEFPFEHVKILEDYDAHPTAESMSISPDRKSSGLAFVDICLDVNVLSSDLQNKLLNIEFNVIFTGGRTKIFKKSIGNIRMFDTAVRQVVSGIHEELPPTWADRVVLGKEDAQIRKVKIQEYLRLYTKQDGTSYSNALSALFLFWVSTNSLHHQLPSHTSGVSNGAKGGFSESTAMDQVPKLGITERPMKPHRGNGLIVERGRIVELISRNTVCLDGWKVRFVDGNCSTMQLENIRQLTDQEARDLIAGHSIEGEYPYQPQEAAENGYTSASTFLGSPSGDGRLSRRRSESISSRSRSSSESTSFAFETNFSVSSCEAFDMLLEDGYVIEGIDSLNQFKDDQNFPCVGDHIEVKFKAYVWNPQTSNLTRFASSDMPKEVSPDPNLASFKIGDGTAIKGLDLAVRRFPYGHKVRVVFSPELAYGVNGLPSYVPPNAHLIFDLTVFPLSGEEEFQSQEEACCPSQRGYCEREKILPLLANESNEAKRKVEKYALRKAENSGSTVPAHPPQLSAVPNPPAVPSPPVVLIKASRSSPVLPSAPRAPPPPVPSSNMGTNAGGIFKPPLPAAPPPGPPALAARPANLADRVANLKNKARSRPNSKDMKQIGQVNIIR